MFKPFNAKKLGPDWRRIVPQPKVEASCEQRRQRAAQLQRGATFSSSAGARAETAGGRAETAGAGVEKAGERVPASEVLTEMPPPRRAVVA